MNYEPILKYCVFKSMFESFKLNSFLLFDYVPDYLLVGKLGRLGLRNELSDENEVLRVVIFS